jgi:hypothetical protein
MDDLEPSNVSILGSITGDGMVWYIDCSICNKRVSEKLKNPRDLDQQLEEHRAEHGVER